jgi:hypothetical protein
MREGRGKPSRFACAPALALALAAATAPAAAAHTLPLRDGRVTTVAPRAGWALACERPGAPRPDAREPWIGARTFDPHRKPVVDGAERWPAASFAILPGSHTLSFAGNGLPLSIATGVFPAAAGDDAAPYAHGAAAIAARVVSGRVARHPRRARRARCIDAALPVGVGLDGVPILPAFDASGRDALAHEVHDACGGRADADGLYARRAPSRCLDRRTGGAHSPQLGYARDGFPIFGSRGAGGRRLRNRDLDACHGHVGRVNVAGVTRRTYHYHLTGEFPYAIGCFRGRPASGWSVGAHIPAGGAPPPGAGPVPVAGPGTTPPEPGQPAIAAEPSLFPAFDAGVTDYVTRCTAGTPLRLTVDAPEGRTVAVDGDPARSGSFTKDVALGADQAFAFASSSSTSSTTYHVRCLPPGFPPWKVEGVGSGQAEWYLSTPSSLPPRPYAVVFDIHGVPVWWIDTGGRPVDFKLLPNGHLAWFDPVNDAGPAYSEHRLDGTRVRDVRAAGTTTDGHELQLLANGNYLLISVVPRDHVDLSPYGGPSDATVLDSVIEEIDPGGALVWSWNTKDHVSLDETGRWWPEVVQHPQFLPDGRPAYDTTHMNAIEPHGAGQVVTSLRHTDGVYAIDRASGAVDWKLGGTARPESLTVLDDPLAPHTLGGQHDPRFEPDGTLTVHDNGTGLVRPPRAVRFRLDTAARTATLVEDVRDAGAQSSFCCGSARKLAGGNWVMGWGGLAQFAELTPAGEVALRVTYTADESPASFSYRTHPVEPGLLSRAALRAGMDARFPR